MFCVQCGKEVNIDAEFCPFCGAGMYNDKNDKNNEEQAVPAVNQNTTVPNTNGFDANGFKKYIDDYINKATRCSSAEGLLKKHFMDHWIVYLWFVIFIAYIVIDAILIYVIDNLAYSILSWVPYLAFIYYGKRLTHSLELKHWIKKPYRDSSGSCKRKVNAKEYFKFMETALGYLSPYLDDWRESDDLIYVRYRRKNNAIVKIHFQNAKIVEEQNIYSMEPDTNSAWSLIKELDCKVRVIPVLKAATKYYDEVYSLNAAAPATSAVSAATPVYSSVGNSDVLTEQKNKKKPYIWIIIGAAVLTVIAIAVVVIVLINSGKNTGYDEYKYEDYAYTDEYDPYEDYTYTDNTYTNNTEPKEEYTLYQNDEYGFSFEYPLGWTKTEGENNAIVDVRDSILGAASCNVTAGYADYEYFQRPMEDIKQDLYAEYATLEGFSNVNVEKFSKAKIAGYDGYEVHASFKNPQNVYISMTQYFFNTEDCMFCISLGDSLDSPYNNPSDFDHIIDTFKVYSGSMFSSDNYGQSDYASQDYSDTYQTVSFNDLFRTDNLVGRRVTFRFHVIYVFDDYVSGYIVNTSDEQFDLNKTVKVSKISGARIASGDILQVYGIYQGVVEISYSSDPYVAMESYELYQ